MCICYAFYKICGKSGFMSVQLTCFFPVGLGNLRRSGPDSDLDTKIFIDYRGKRSVQSLNNSAGRGRVISLRRRYAFLASFWL